MQYTICHIPGWCSEQLTSDSVPHLGGQFPLKIFYYQRCSNYIYKQPPRKVAPLGWLDFSSPWTPPLHGWGSCKKIWSQTHTTKLSLFKPVEAKGLLGFLIVRWRPCCVQPRAPQLCQGLLQCRLYHIIVVKPKVRLHRLLQEF